MLARNQTFLVQKRDVSRCLVTEERGVDMYTFEEIIGHKAVVHHLQTAIKNQKVSHGYIIDGEQGMGKKTIAMTLAKTLQCKEEGITPCNVCTSCKTFDSGNHPDYMVVKHKKT